MYHLILIVLLSASQPIVIDKVAVLPKEVEMPKFKRRKQAQSKVWYAKYF